ncbi:hypothetical protein J7E38_18330 [Bacillus sp. ISL-35]|uniref:hypothetical protein n=1 Tax=Bacillus sp. ISL-35 TaxID=2819122 RepID=UPI001BECE80B|nr:hypothetical protein [Bacillus sp. ISL-35]MBT2680952.1 hypothetical protein [Bacillus sp. ISL-35]MBT2705269.1 hypothetical protein [Chryseobacterium sp. ISL-80]
MYRELYFRKEDTLSDTPNTIKKKELESYLEEFAAEQGIDFEKKEEPTRTIYSFTVQGQVALVEFFYRYSHFYTRHSITLK